MIILIAGASHTGKTCLAQRMLRTYGYPYLSIDHLKMGLIRSGNTALTPLSDDRELTAYLWPIVREMIKTAIENGQDLIVEGCYIPLDWARDFAAEYRECIRYICLVMSERYIREHFADILRYANVIEHRLADDCTMQGLIEENREVQRQAEANGIEYLYIDEQYQIDVKLPAKEDGDANGECNRSGV